MWIAFAILARIFWAIMNAVDQLLARAHPRHNTLAAMVVEGLSHLPYVFVLYAFAGPFPYHPQLAAYSVGIVIAVVSGAVPYYFALRHEPAHNVVPYLELTPVFMIGLAYLLKGEVLTPLQLLGALIVIVSGFLFSWDFAHGRFKISIFALLAAASLFFALQQYCLSEAELFGSIWAVCCYYYLGSGLVACGAFLAKRDLRKTIMETCVKTKGGTLALGLGTSFLSLFGLATLMLAFRLAPTLGHVAGFSGTQPIFSFALAFPLARFFPRHFEKVVLDREARAKMALILGIAAGAWLLATP